MVPDEKNIFGAEYVNDPKGTTPSAEGKKKDAEGLDVDSHKYGIAKPKRKIIKGTLFND